MQDQLYVNQSGIIYLRRNGEDIEISDQEKAKHRLYPFAKHKINASFGEWESEGIKPGIYPIPDLQYEVKEELEYPIDHTSYPPYRKVAILKESSTEQESQEELTESQIDELWVEYQWGASMPQKEYDLMESAFKGAILFLIEKGFIITRK